MAFSAMKKANQFIAHNATQRRIAFYGQEGGSKVHEGREHGIAWAGGRSSHIEMKIE